MCPLPHMSPTAVLEQLHDYSGTRNNYRDSVPIMCSDRYFTHRRNHLQHVLLVGRKGQLPKDCFDLLSGEPVLQVASNGTLLSIGKGLLTATRGRTYSATSVKTVPHAQRCHLKSSPQIIHHVQRAALRLYLVHLTQKVSKHRGIHDLTISFSATWFSNRFLLQKSID